MKMSFKFSIVVIVGIFSLSHEASVKSRILNPSKKPSKLDPLILDGEDILGDANQENRNAVNVVAALWPGGYVYYELDPKLSEVAKAAFKEAVDDFKNFTCITFVPRSYQYSYVYIYPGDGCASFVGRIGGKQIFSIGPGCERKGIVMHELMHVIGFHHEQNRADRDEYVTINFKNIKTGKKSEFDKQSLYDATTLGLPYDYSSLTHYGMLHFSKDGSSPTIVPTDSSATIGQREGLSEMDVTKIEKLYLCPSKSSNNLPPATTVAPYYTPYRWAPAWYR